MIHSEGVQGSSYIYSSLPMWYIWVLYHCLLICPLILHSGQIPGSCQVEGREVLLHSATGPSPSTTRLTLLPPTDECKEHNRHH